VFLSFLPLRVYCSKTQETENHRTRCHEGLTRSCQVSREILGGKKLWHFSSKKQAKYLQNFNKKLKQNFAAFSLDLLPCFQWCILKTVTSKGQRTKYRKSNFLDLEKILFFMQTHSQKAMSKFGWYL